MVGVVYSLVGWLIISVYGGKVCPVIAQYPFWKWSLLCLSGYAVMACARFLLEPRTVAAAQLHRQSSRQLGLELSLTALTALGLSLAARLIVHSPPENAFKVGVAVLLLGLFFSLELSLRRERQAALTARFDPDLGFTDGFRGDRYFSLTTKFALVAAAAVLMAAVAVSGVVIKDIFIFFSGDMAGDWSHNIRIVVLDIFYVLGVLLCQGLLCLWSYAKNLKLYFALETAVLERVAGGDLDASVPVMTRDEFGHIAARTNQMIEGLRERRVIKDIFGKLVSPAIAKRLLSSGPAGATLGGERVQAVVLFADIRNFTTFSETRPPEEVLARLNDLFTRLVQAVHGQGGLVDKFIGDAVLAVFGLDGEPGAAEKAVTAALAMVQEAVPFQIGAGIHLGPVVAGNVGSPERLEFTVIGDTVNTASRLQDATKELGSALAISPGVLAALPSGLKELFQSFGERKLKGKSENMEIFGLKPRP